MNVQTERIEDHKARFTVEVPLDEWEKAKKRSARSMAKRYKIPGFRKGKAPYRIIQKYLGEESIVSETVENLGNEVYRQALDESGVDPYASGSLEDFSEDPPTYVFTVPLQPEVDVQEYRDIRLDYEAPSVDDDQVDRAMRQIQQREAVVEESAEPVAIGNRVTADIHSEFVDDAPEIEEADGDDTDPDAEEPTIPQAGDQFFHQHDAKFDLDPENEPVVPGFIEALVGTNVEETLEFDLTLPEDDDDYKDIAGREVHFSVTIKKVEVVTMPELNDDLAARVTEDEDEPLTLLELRMRTREELQEQAERQAEDAYGLAVLDEIVAQADIAFPLEMLNERIHDMLEDMDRELQQQGLNLETYQQVMGVTHEDLHEQYEPEATQSIQRSLVLGEMIAAERIQVDNADIDAEIEKMLAQFGEQADMFRQYFDTPQQRNSMANSLAYQKLMARIVAIGRGEAPSLQELEQADEPEAVQADEEDSTETEMAAAERDAAEAEESDVRSDAPSEADIADANADDNSGDAQAADASDEPKTEV